MLASQVRDQSLLRVIGTSRRSDRHIHRLRPLEKGVEANLGEETPYNWNVVIAAARMDALVAASGPKPKIKLPKMQFRSGDDERWQRPTQREAMRI